MEFKCPECGGQLQATEKVWWSIDENGEANFYDSDFSLPGEPHVYCMNDHDIEVGTELYNAVLDAVTITARREHRVEVLHSRDSDAGCDIAIFVNGEGVDPIKRVGFDPGAGYEREDWNAIRDEFDGLSPAAREVAEEWFEAASDSKYIEDH